MEQQATTGYTGLGMVVMATGMDPERDGEIDVFCIVRENEGDQRGRTLRDALDAAMGAALSGFTGPTQAQIEGAERVLHESWERDLK